MDKLTEPIIGRFYTYDHSDYTNTSLFFRRVRGFYYFIETDDGGDPSSLWVNKVTLNEFNETFHETDLDFSNENDVYTLECFFNGLKNLIEENDYYSCTIEDIELTDEDFEYIKNSVSVFKTINHYGNSRENYEEYLTSKQWKQIRAMMFNKIHKCQLCGSKENLEIHHNSYEHVGEEKNHLEDLVVLCHDCHSLFHHQKRIQ